MNVTFSVRAAACLGFFRGEEGFRASGRELKALPPLARTEELLAFLGRATEALRYLGGRRAAARVTTENDQRNINEDVAPSAYSVPSGYDKPERL